MGEKSVSMTIATAIFGTATELAEFLRTLKMLELGKTEHHAKPIELELDSDGYKLTLFIAEHAEFLINASLTDGMLREWGKQFVISKV